jgi:hypothetical protein
MHFDLGQLHPVGLSFRGPSSSVAEHKRSSLSNRPSKGSERVLTRFVEGGDGDEFQESLERLPRLSSAGDSASLDEDTISLGMTMS